MFVISKKGNTSEIDTLPVIKGNCLDELVKNGINYILNHNRKISSRAGEAIQAYGVNYILLNPHNRLQYSRKGSIKYLSRELLAYFKGSLKAQDGLANASQFWMTLVDKDGNVNSNYGYYVFYESVTGYGNQYQWAKSCLLKNKDSRRAIININQNYHKSETKDFPCTIGIQFYIKENKLFCETTSRSTDVITGLPYDMGFFSFIHELLWKDLTENGLKNLKLGPTIMKTTFTQLYNRTFSKAIEVMKYVDTESQEVMPFIESAKDTLTDILTNEKKTDIIKWIYAHAK